MRRSSRFESGCGCVRSASRTALPTRPNYVYADQNVGPFNDAFRRIVVSKTDLPAQRAPVSHEDRTMNGSLPMIDPQPTLRARQTGATLIVGLVLLLVLTVSACRA